MNAVENKIPNVSDLVKKADYDAKISDIGSKYFTTADFNKFTSQTLDAKIKQKKLADKSPTTLAAKAELKAKQDEIIKLQAFDSIHFRGKSHFEDDGTQNYWCFSQYTDIL